MYIYHFGLKYFLPMFYEKVIVIVAKLSVLHCQALCYNNKVICVKTTML